MIHPTAVIHPAAILGPSVSVGPYSIIGEHVEIGAGTTIGPHVVIEGRTRIGADNRIFQFCSLGAVPQDKKYAGEPTMLDIGDRNTIREFCTFHAGTTQDTGITRIGNDNWIMAYVHLAHDCQVGNGTIFANNAQLAGHVHVGDFAVLGGFTVVHQFVSIGMLSLTAMGTILLQDLPPYIIAAGNTARPFGINAEGLKRRGYSPDALAIIKSAYKTIYKSGLSLEEAKKTLAEEASRHSEVQPLVEFLRHSRRSVIR
ncbi:MAG: acyl-ACP--UDP-N-acetylglucosamine O-acyltransferase [Betaproteobacteria bacterium]|nr:acyl-ACP--UDP-N-acetylglucosamine O-acyltransferase [Betaproteobacteria bacterium]